MDPEEFRQAGHALVDWIADYRTQLADGPVQAAVTPGEVAAALPAHPPEQVDRIGALLDDLDRIIVPGLTQVQHPAHFGWFPSNASLSSVLGDLASSGLGAIGISWQSAPALTEMEEVVCDWLAQLTGMPPGWRGAIHDTASSACLVALLAARERAGAFSARRGGLQSLPAPLVVYSSAEAHSSVAKAVLLAGFGQDNLRLVEVDERTRAIRPEALRAAIEADVAAGRVPAAVVATVGSTATTAADPVAAIAGIAAEHQVWVHVDAAMAGSALLLPECRPLVDGLADAHSLAWNPHKWLGTVLDCALLYVRDPGDLVRVLATDPSYLRSPADGRVTQFRDWGIPLGRRFRALKPWFQLRLDGVEAIRARLRRDLANAAWLAGQARDEPGWRVPYPVPLQTVCLRHEPAGLDGPELDRHTLHWVEAVNASGKAFLTPAQVGGRWLARVSIGAENTERADVERLWELIRECAGGDLSPKAVSEPIRPRTGC